MHIFTAVFLTLLAIVVVAQLWLAQRQIAYVAAHRGSVPREFEDQVPLDAHQKAADYTLARARLGRIENVYGAILLLGWTVGGGLNLVDEFWRRQFEGEIATGVVFLLSVVLLTSVLELPFTVYRIFVLERQFGFNRTTLGLFILDLIKQAILAVLIGTPLLLAALWLMQSSGGLWWVYVWLLWTAFSLFMVWAYPTLIAPLFNRFKPLDRDSLRARLQALLARTGFRSEGIFVVDSSRRTAHGNAYFTGFGRSKRVVFFDNLLDQLAENEVEAVVAHELGHYRLHHIVKRMVLVITMSFLALALLGWLADQPWFYQALGVDRSSNHAALALFVLATPVFTFFLTPLIARRSRRHEHEADGFAAEQSDARALIGALVKLYKENATTLTPDPLHSAFYDSHPPALERIGQLRRSHAQ
jgi:STE24 endopeptidase